MYVAGDRFNGSYYAPRYWLLYTPAAAAAYTYMFQFLIVKQEANLDAGHLGSNVS